MPFVVEDQEQSTEREQKQDERILAAFAHLEGLIARKAKPEKIKAAQRRLSEIRAEVARDEEEAEELARIERGVKRKQDGEAATAQAKKRREAEQAFRKGHAPTIVVSYAGIKITIQPDAVADQVVRGTSLESLRRVLSLVRNDFDMAVAAHGMDSIGKTPTRVRIFSD